MHDPQYQNDILPPTKGGLLTNIALACPTQGTLSIVFARTTHVQAADTTQMRLSMKFGISILNVHLSLEKQIGHLLS